MRKCFSRPMISKMCAFFILFFTNGVFAQSQDIGAVASKITQSFQSVTNLIEGAAYLTGATMFFIAIFQFRQHKENPTQTPLSKPMMFLGIAAALLFFPTLVSVTKTTVFGSAAQTCGPRGTSCSLG